jgi:hypothetical protein
MEQHINVKGLCYFLDFRTVRKEKALVKSKLTWPQWAMEMNLGF